MASLRLPVNSALQKAARLPSTTDQTAVVDYLVLLGFGVVAATFTILADFSLKIPGHAILRVVLPFAFGLASVPRHGAGSVMGFGALLGGDGRGRGFARGVLRSWKASPHPGGVHFTFADGHATFLSETIDLDTLHALTTRNGGEVIPEY